MARRYEYHFRVVKTIMWAEVGRREQRTYKFRGKIHAFFTRYIFFHVCTSENMENTSVLVYGKTPIAI